MSSFRVGQKVVCVDDKPLGFSRGFHPSEAVKVGTVYTVRRIFIDDEGDVILQLDEVERSDIAKRQWRTDELGYAAFRFRPIVERKTSISIFKAMLNPSRVKEHA